MNFLDKLPAALRHAVLMAFALLVSAGLAWAQSDYTNWNLPPALVGAVGVVLSLAVVYVTPFTSQYGVGAAVAAAPDNVAADGGQE